MKQADLQERIQAVNVYIFQGGLQGEMKRLENVYIDNAATRVIGCRVNVAPRVIEEGCCDTCLFLSSCKRLH